MTTGHDRRGVTMVELTMVVLLSTILLAAIYQVLVTNQRTYAAQSAEVQGQQTLRAGVDILFAELREISPGEGDLIVMDDDRIHVRAVRAFGIVCDIVAHGTPPTVLVRQIGRPLQEDSVRVLFENDTRFWDDDVWKTAEVTALDTGLFSCPDGEATQEVTLSGVTSGPPPDSLRRGAPIRNFAHYEFALGTYDGDPYLVREDPDGTVNPLVGPVDPGDGLRFRYLDADGNVTATPAEVRQIEITLRTNPERRNLQGDPLSDSLVARIRTRGATDN